MRKKCTCLRRDSQNKKNNPQNSCKTSRRKKKRKKKKAKKVRFPGGKRRKGQHKSKAAKVPAFPNLRLPEPIRRMQRCAHRRFRILRIVCHIDDSCLSSVWARRIHRK